MQIIINGSSAAADYSSIEEMLSKEDLDPKLVVVELNGKIIPRDAYASTLLKEGDSVEIVQFVAGG